MALLARRAIAAPGATPSCSARGAGAQPCAASRGFVPRARSRRAQRPRESTRSAFPTRLRQTGNDAIAAKRGSIRASAPVRAAPTRKWRPAATNAKPDRGSAPGRPTARGSREKFPDHDHCDGGAEPRESASRDPARQQRQHQHEDGVRSRHRDHRASQMGPETQSVRSRNRRNNAATTPGAPAPAGRHLLIERRPPLRARGRVRRVPYQPDHRRSRCLSQRLEKSRVSTREPTGNEGDTSAPRNANAFFSIEYASPEGKSRIPPWPQRRAAGDDGAQPAIARFGDTLPSALHVAVAPGLADRRRLNTRDLLAAIDRDLALTARILRTANSPFAQTRSVTSVTRGVVLGPPTIRNPTPGPPWDATTTRCAAGAHALGALLAVAHAAQFLAHAHRAQAGGDAFTAGLLHDVGKMIREAVPGRVPSFVEAAMTPFPPESERAGRRSRPPRRPARCSSSAGGCRRSSVEAVAPPRPDASCGVAGWSAPWNTCSAAATTTARPLPSSERPRPASPRSSGARTRARQQLRSSGESRTQLFRRRGGHRASGERAHK